MSKYVAYAGSYTHESSKGIQIFDMDVEKGRIIKRKEIEIDNPSYVTFSHSGKCLYSICDQGVAAYTILPDGDLELLNVLSINGMRGCHITVTKDDQFIIISGYHDGKITVVALTDDGCLDHIADEVFHKGMGSIADRNFRPHASWSVFTPDEELLCVCDLGIDQIKLYEFNHRTGKLRLHDIIRSQLESAPRQMVFSPDGRFAYVLCELKNYINVYSYDKNSDKNRFELVQNIFTVRKGHKSNSAAAHLIFSNSGDNLICSNAGDNTVTIYKVNKEDGTLSSISSLPVSGDYPKYISMFPDDKHILSMNHEGNSITIFTIHFDKGLIVMNGPELKVSKPNNLIIKEL
ncbi:MAG: lactonase family protein [Lachnospira sp.]|nr:lactonase family protein [Lachnospira sp.]